MTVTNEDTRARRYLLGQSSDEESSALEREYFADERALDRIAGAEDALIEAHLAGTLSAGERERFERHYLASPEHRARVEVVRRLSATPRRAWYGSAALLATAAALVLAVGAAVWLAAPQAPPQIVTAPPAPVAPATPAPPAPRVFAIALPPYTMRGGTASPPAVIPTDVDVVALQLPRGSVAASDKGAEVRIQTVSGAEVWRGPVVLTADPSGPVQAHADVPAARLPSDDYVVVVRTAGPSDREMYALRIRKQ